MPKCLPSLLSTSFSAGCSSACWGWSWLFGLCLCFWPDVAFAHEGPDAIGDWYVTKQKVQGNVLKALLGPDASLHGGPGLVEDAWGAALQLDGADDYLSINPQDELLASRFQGTKFTVSTWIRIDRRVNLAGIAGAATKFAEGEKGWVLGYDSEAFTFRLATADRDDGNGRFTKLRGKTPYQLGKTYHVVATYDGQEARLYVNGELDAVSRELSGPIIFAGGTTLTLGAFLDRDELYPHAGQLRSVQLYDVVATADWVAGEFAHNKELAEQNSLQKLPETLTWVVSPYLQYVTKTGITVSCETSLPGQCVVRYGLDDQLTNVSEPTTAGTLHHVRLEPLLPQHGYYYQVEVTTEAGVKIQSPLLSFQSANEDDTPFMFGVIGDTQFNPTVSKQVTDMIWANRPNFFMIAGDLTDTGTNKSHWTDHFFPGVQPLASRVSMFPVLGNHEQNAKHYYDYMALPDPEYYYTFSYGNAQFFMLDSNKELAPGSEQYQWLEKTLAASTARWKFACYHHPSYSSDEDDYGNLWRGPSVFGDLRLRPLSDLYDRYGVDIVWNGHIHSYERTWPLHADKPVEQQGTIFVVTGGAGGGLETAGPIKPYFQNTVKHGHHFCLVSINGGTLEFKAIDLEGRLFDTLTIRKGPLNPTAELPLQADIDKSAKLSDRAK